MEFLVVGDRGMDALSVVSVVAFGYEVIHCAVSISKSLANKHTTTLAAVVTSLRNCAVTRHGNASPGFHTQPFRNFSFKKIAKETDLVAAAELDKTHPSGLTKKIVGFSGVSAKVKELFFNTYRHYQGPTLQPASLGFFCPNSDRSEPAYFDGPTLQFARC